MSRRTRFRVSHDIFIMCAALSVVAAAGSATAGASAGSPSVELVLRTNAVDVPGEGAGYSDVLQTSLDWTFGRSAVSDGSRLHVDLVHTFNQSRGRLSQTFGAVDSDAVQTRHFRIYQAWMEQSLGSGAASLRGGVYDLKTEFGVLQSARGLLNPSFGLDPELALSGAGDAPSFPSTSLGARLRLQQDGPAYVMAAALDARPGAAGDPDGVDLTLSRGALLVVETGLAAKDKVAFGAWRYTQTQRLPAGRGRQWPSAPGPDAGAYLILERRLLSPGGSGPGVDLFGRVGGAAQSGAPFVGSWQVGVRIDRPIPGRPDSSLSAGLTEAAYDRRLARRLVGGPFSRVPARSALEVSYADQVGPFVMLQPDVQWARTFMAPGGFRNALAFTLRATFRLRSS